MKICLIRPSTVLRLFSMAARPTAPLGLAFIAGALKKAGHDVVVIDAIAEKSNQFFKLDDEIHVNGLTNKEIVDMIPPDTDLIGVSLMFTNNWLNDRRLLSLIGQELPGIMVIAGGEHITGLPEICMKQASVLKAVVLGEGEETIVELVDAFQNEQDLSLVEGIAYRSNEEIIINSRRKRIRNVGEIPRPDWDLFPIDSYRDNELSYGVIKGELSLPIMATRGCPYSCTFCSSPQMWGTRYYMRSPEDVADEMENLKNKYRATNFDFYDLTAIINKKWIIDFAQELIDRNLNVTWQIPAGTRAEVIDSEVARYLFKSGCKFITYAPESGSTEILKLIKKKVVLSNMLKSISDTYKEGMTIKLNMIVGFPGETHKHVFESLLFLVKAAWYGADDMFPTILVPYTGCEIFDNLVKNGTIDPNDDDYYKRVIYGDSFFKGFFYNEKMSHLSARIYRLLYLFIFYFSSIIFRPGRIFKTIKNVLTQNFETRSEYTLYETIRRALPGVKAKGGKTRIIVSK
jgi:anaerobic magnesium-protoporphyrin IX monomethyl ester cyclase